MDHSKFREALHGLLTRQPLLRRKFKAALQDEVLKTRKTAVDRHYLVWQSLMKLEELAPQALELIRSESEDLETWHEHKINLAAEYLESVVDSLRCKAEHEIPPFDCDDQEDGTESEEDVVFGDDPLEPAEDNLEIEDFE
jgi:signal transduction histidine kinase